MSVRAVIVDVYQTLLEVGPAPADAAARWEALWHQRLGGSMRRSLAEFGADYRAIIEREHAAAQAVGIQNPEIYWPWVAPAALPELARLNQRELADFLFEHAQLVRTLRLMPGAAELLATLSRRPLLLGIASNSQPYTLRELDVALAAVGLSRAVFQADLCFWSFAFGFSKPNPHVFRFLTARLQGRGVKPSEVLMVGDREDNDLDPARAQGWQTWRLVPPGGDDSAIAGDWHQLARRLSA